MAIAHRVCAVKYPLYFVFHIVVTWQAGREPAVRGEVYGALPETAATHFNAFLGKSGFLACGAPRPSLESISKAREFESFAATSPRADDTFGVDNSLPGHGVAVVACVWLVVG